MADRQGPRKPIVGILGGMGPMATADLMAKIVANTPVTAEYEHLPIIAWSNPEIPDRTQALLGIGPSPVPAMADGVDRLVTAGAEVIAIPCNTAHAFLNDLSERTGACFLNMIEIAIDAVLGDVPDVRRVGVLSTRGTRLAGLYEAACGRRGITALALGEDHQAALVDRAIRKVKVGDDLTGAALLVREAADKLAGLGAETVIAGCTEIPLVASGAAEILPVVDATDCLAAAVVRLVAQGGGTSPHVSRSILGPDDQARATAPTRGATRS